MLITQLAIGFLSCTLIGITIFQLRFLFQQDLCLRACHREFRLRRCHGPPAQRAVPCQISLGQNLRRLLFLIGVPPTLALA